MVIKTPAPQSVLSPPRTHHGTGTLARLAWLAPAALVLLAALLPPRTARAALGDDAMAVENDARQLRASHRVLERPAFSVHELATPEGTTIREFVGPGGAVFAVSWRGPFRPDMRTLLGNHYQDYVAAPRSAESSRTRLKIEQPKLVVHAAGHMHAFRGLAYLPDAMPAGVSAGDLQ
jgi:hypothetical protein